MNFLTSDTHFLHTNIIRFCHRPFTTVEEMNETMINNWNSVVRDGDTVYHLGDFAFGRVREIINIREQLNGHIILIEGNHDIKNITKQKLGRLFDEVRGSAVVVHGNVKCHLSHYPYLCWPGSYRFEPQFFGHVHLHPGYTGSDLDVLKEHGTPVQYDVGVDLNGFTPITFDEAIEKVRYQQERNTNTFKTYCM